MATDIHSSGIVHLEGGYKTRGARGAKPHSTPDSALKRNRSHQRSQPLRRRRHRPLRPPDIRAEMLAPQTITLVALLAIVHICLSYPPIRTRGVQKRECRGCGDDCDKCLYGVAVTEYCGVLECRKGPNESCGGSQDMDGFCGDGMTCHCERCTGCSADTLKCATQLPDGPCRPRELGMDGGYWNALRQNRFTLLQ